MGCKIASTPMETNVDLWFDDSHTLDDPGRHRRLIGKLMYFTVTGPNITFTVGLLSRFVHQLRETHWLAAIRVLTYIKSCPRNCTGNIGMYAFLDTRIQDVLVNEEIGSLHTFVRGNLVT